MDFKRVRIAQLSIIAIAAGGGLPFINAIGIEYSFSKLSFFKQTILAIIIECGLYLILSWIVGTIYKIARPLFLREHGDVHG